jgi:hypothetical protein
MASPHGSPSDRGFYFFWVWAGFAPTPGLFGGGVSSLTVFVPEG